MDETFLRLAIFIAVLLFLAAAERSWPRRTGRLTQSRRWLTNLSLAAISSVVVRIMGALAAPLAAVGAAGVAQAAGFGVFNWIALPAWVETTISVVVLDLAIWVQHFVSHNIPFLWRLHQVHHADGDIDVTTGVRFHPFEIALSMVWKAVVVALLGASVVSVLIFEVVLNSLAMFSHANLRLPDRWDSWLRTVIVTPDMHRVHHSVHRDEHDSNYGFNLSLWDRVFGTYRAQPRDGQLGMTLGLREYQVSPVEDLGWSLTLPFAKQHAAKNGRSKRV